MSVRTRVDSLLKKFEKTYQPLNTVELSRSALLGNFDLLKKLSPGEVIPVVKANAYGHGLREVVQILKARQFPYLAVDGYFEALKIREVSRQPVLVMGAIGTENYSHLETTGFSYVVSSLLTLEALARRRRKVTIHIEVDTGMHRHGVDLSQLGRLLKTVRAHPQLQLEGVMSHLADADNADNSYTEAQVAKFDQAVEVVLRAGLKPKWLHLAQTPGSAKVKSKYANAIRPGIGMYGINPLTPPDPAYKKLQALRPVMSIKSRIGLVRHLKPGDRVSYNGIFKAKKPMRMGVLPLGYSEGIPRSLANQGLFKAGRHYLPVIGKVCMNHTMIDLKATTLREGDPVIVISNNPKDKNSVRQLCQRFNYFNYRFLTAISPTIRRVIVD